MTKYKEEYLKAQAEINTIKSMNSGYDTVGENIPLSVTMEAYFENDPQYLPKHKTLGSAGLDLHAKIDRPITLKPLERCTVGTGLHLNIPPYHEVQIRARSGLAHKYGITVLNSPATIDSDFKGELCIIIVNLSNEEYTIQPNERVAQMLLKKYERVTLLQVDNMDAWENTERGGKGFGSTGKL